MFNSRAPARQELDSNLDVITKLTFVAGVAIAGWLWGTKIWSAMSDGGLDLLDKTLFSVMPGIGFYILGGAVAASPTLLLSFCVNRAGLSQSRPETITTTTGSDETVSNPALPATSSASADKHDEAKSARAMNEATISVNIPTVGRLGKFASSSNKSTLPEAISNKESIDADNIDTANANYSAEHHTFKITIDAPSHYSTATPGHRR